MEIQKNKTNISYNLKKDKGKHNKLNITFKKL